MALLATQEIAPGGAAPTFTAAAAGGDNFQPAEGVSLIIKNGDSASHTATVTSIVPCSQGFHHDVAIVVAASGEEVAGPFPPERFAGGNGLASIAYSAVTMVTIAVVHEAQQ